MGIAGLAVVSFAQVDASRVIATVNGEEVKGAEYYHRMEFLTGVGKRMGTSYVEFPPGFLTLEEIITEKLILQLAKDKGVYPTDVEVQAEYADRQKNAPKMLEDWLAGGKTTEDLVQQIRIEMAQFKIQTAGITITDQQVDDYYKNNPNSFTVPKRYKLRTIVVTSETAKTSVDGALGSGKAFSEVATQFSEDLTKMNGGEFGALPVNLIPEGATRDAILATKIGKTTPWLVAGDKTWAKFLLEDVIPEKTTELTPGVRKSIRRQLMLMKGREKNNVAKDMAALRASAKINIEQKSFADAYAKFMQAYLKEQTAKKGG